MRFMRQTLLDDLPCFSAHRRESALGPGSTGPLPSPALSPISPASADRPAHSAGLLPAARQAGQSHRPQPHSHILRHCRLALGIWPSCGCCWPRARPPGLDAWAQRMASAAAGCKDCSSSPRFLFCSPWPTCLSIGIGHRISLSYGISVQGWSSWLGDLAKALGLAVLIGAPCCCSSTGSSAAGPAATGWQPGWHALPLMVLSLCLAAAGAGLQQIRAARQKSSRPGRRSWKGRGPHRNQHSALSACF
jgi:hypothetical protein